MIKLSEPFFKFLSSNLKSTIAFPFCCLNSSELYLASFIPGIKLKKSLTAGKKYFFLSIKFSGVSSYIPFLFKSTNSSPISYLLLIVSINDSSCRLLPLIFFSCNLFAYDRVFLLQYPSVSLIKKLLFL